MGKRAQVLGRHPIYSEYCLARILLKTLHPESESCDMRRSSASWTIEPASDGWLAEVQFSREIIQFFFDVVDNIGKYIGMIWLIKIN